MDLNLLFIGLSVSAMTLARRWKNKDPYAGVGIAGWGIILIGIYAIASL